MSLSFEGFVQRRPFLYHLTSQSNLASIKSSGELFSATDLLESAGREQLIGKKRPKSVQIALKGLSISLRDQEPLHAGNIELQHGWTFSDVVEMLNKHVYFWPGTASGPIDYGVRHYARYEALGEKLVMLRLEAADLLNANPGNRPCFSRYNSGSPRCSGGKRSPRGDDTFQSERDFAGTPSTVVEVVFRGSVRLPSSVGYGVLSGGGWQ